MVVCDIFLISYRSYRSHQSSNNFVVTWCESDSIGWPLPFIICWHPWTRNAAKKKTKRKANSSKPYRQALSQHRPCSSMAPCLSWHGSQRVMEPDLEDDLCDVTSSKTKKTTVNMQPGLDHLFLNSLQMRCQCIVHHMGPGSKIGVSVVQKTWAEENKTVVIVVPITSFEPATSPDLKHHLLVRLFPLAALPALSLRRRQSPRYNCLKNKPLVFRPRALHKKVI